MIVDRRNASDQFGGYLLYFLAAIPALIISIIMWFLASNWVAASIEWVESRRPDLVGSKQLRVGEAVACGALVVATFALAFWIMRLLVAQMK